MAELSRAERRRQERAAERAAAAGQPPPDVARSRRRVLVWGAVIAFLALVFVQVLDPFGADGYVEINHGNHKHYVPVDRDPSVPLDRFPGTPPGPDERILPDGRVVPKE